ncbi:NAD-binding protein [Erysipelothrix sp. Poltava]|nr:NAD-binding protein [Erysipelothrix sp. Poltava]
MTNKTVAILGLGLFGASIAKTLARHKVDVIAMDSKMERVEEVANLVEHAVQADFTKLEQLEACGCRKCRYRNYCVGRTFGIHNPRCSKS